MSLMSSKDWVLLLTPIFFNGVFLFAFQEIIKRWFNKTKAADERKKLIVDSFLEQLEKSMEVISEVEKQFRFGEDMRSINEEVCNTISKMCQYGKNHNSVLGMYKSLEKLRAQCGYCHCMLNQYQSCGVERALRYPQEDQEKILEFITEIKRTLRKMISQAIKL